MIIKSRDLRLCSAVHLVITIFLLFAAFILAKEGAYVSTFFVALGVFFSLFNFLQGYRASILMDSVPHNALAGKVEAFWKILIINGVLVNIFVWLIIENYKVTKLSECAVYRIESDACSWDRRTALLIPIDLNSRGLGHGNDDSRARS
jgi:hypothetical protein